MDKETAKMIMRKTKAKKTTNYDRIKAMSVEEMIEFMQRCNWNYPPYCDYQESKSCDYNCIKCAKNFLESEVDTE